MLMTPGDIVMMLNEMGGMRVRRRRRRSVRPGAHSRHARSLYARAVGRSAAVWRGRRTWSAPDSADGSGTGRGHQRCGLGVIWRRCDGWRHQPAVAASNGRTHRGVPAQSVHTGRNGCGHFFLPFLRAWVEWFLARWRPLAGDQRRQRRCLGRSPRLFARVVRPRVFWDGGDGRTFFATTGFTYEDRQGGTPDGEVLVATGQPYVEALETRRYDAGAVGQFLVKDRYVVPRVRRLLARATITSSAKSSSGIGTTRRLAKQPSVEPRADRHGSPDSPSSVTLIRRATSRDSTMTSSCQAHSRGTTSPCRRNCRCPEALASIITASTAHSSVLVCRHWHVQDIGRAGFSGDRLLRADAHHRGN